MTYNEYLDMKISVITSGWQTTRRKMFGGTRHLVNGNIMCGVHKGYLILRLGEDQGIGHIIL